MLIKKVTNSDGTDKPDAGNVANINKAPLTAEEAADLLKPTTKDGKSNPNFVGNNAATVSDVFECGLEFTKTMALQKTS